MIRGIAFGAMRKGRDSFWQMAMLVGVLDVVPMRGKLLAYDVPSYFGMLCAGYTRSI